MGGSAPNHAVVTAHPAGVRSTVLALLHPLPRNLVMIPRMVRFALGAFLTIPHIEHAARAQELAPATPSKPAGPQEIRLEVTRQQLPTPLFRYRLTPMAGALNPGNAAPIYLRLNQETSSEGIREMHKQAVEWLDLPITDLPVADAGKLVGVWSGRVRQIEFGTRRQACDWDYTLEEQRDNPLAILLPDTQAMRTWGRLLALKARYEVATGATSQAIQTLGTGIAFGRHVGEGPFIINKLVGIALINGMLAQADELVARPGTPNLYWALTALPSPLVGMREAIEIERASIGRTLTGQVLEEIDLARPRSDAEWSTLLADLHARMGRADSLYGPNPQPDHALTPGLPLFRVAMLPQARDYLKAHQLTATSDDQALVLAIIGQYRELADENFKLAYVPYPDALKLQTGAIEPIKAAKLGPAVSMTLLLPAVEAALRAEANLARKVAALRVIEALRLSAAEHDGQLPGTLDEVKAVPVPPDPITGRPFEYRREGASAVLTGVSPTPAFRLTYRITVRP